ncbi:MULTISPECIES: DUF2848 domain-containing protein [Sphingobium]|uniref:DUF2848 domain-containing protein n=1 Tax=Sphingobium fuliginis (strain ATCC 27551) TaxID=336203 RepID=A0ABQ1F6W5_SPHSA|nr:MULTISPECIES: DUF2848 domain-containing protein [Sphingobium]RYL96298.1 DUF2848 domain-containing protein [Sphingobium fuliginis]WDA36166.1 DUF2848 domain-containing protein [Sphingobium sp. YC-XJ3]GGA01436.1 hypothetical protein GCM10019071_35040 [Sphingobium fuliginis]
MRELKIVSDDGAKSVPFEPEQLVIAGWTGRDEAVLEAHIQELEELGVKRPSSVPVYYRVDHALLSTRPAIQVVGRESSGEAEVVLFKHEGALYVGLGSDHTDRALEAFGISLSKQACAKPIAASAWRWQDVCGHWDQLQLSSHTVEDGEQFYQHGSVAGLRRPDELLALYERQHGTVPNGFAMFCGTLPVSGEIRFSDRFTIVLHDPVLGRTLRHSYAIEALPVAEA